MRPYLGHTWGTWIGGPQHCIPKHLRDQLQLHLTYGTGRHRTSPW